MKNWLYLCIICVQFGFSQKEANIWYFGNKAGLDFNSGAPMAIMDNALPLPLTLETTASIADQNGDLLFYSDGKRILNKKHELMLEGQLFSQESNIITSLLIVPKPDSSSIYYLFYTAFNNEQLTDIGLMYSEIDMSLDNGLGGVTVSKNISLNPNVYNLSATVHDNGNDIWVVTYNNLNRTFYSYLVTDSGIKVTPITSDTGVINDYSTLYDANIKLAPNGKKLIVLNYESSYLHEFNNVNGTVGSSPLKIKDNFWASPRSYAEFSSSGNVLYISEYENQFGTGAVYQYNLNAANIPDSEIEISNSTVWGFFDMQIGTDQKIYISNIGHNYIGVINNPETLGIGCDFDFDGVYLNGRSCYAGLPHFIQYNFRVEIQTENVCLGDATQFRFNSSKSFDSLLWDFGDGNTSTDEEPLHNYANAGDYTVTLSVTSGSKTLTESKTLTIYEPPIVTPIIELKQCDDDLDGFILFNLNEAISEITANSATETITFFESETDAINNNNPITDATTYLNQTASTDAVWARVENSNGCFMTSKVSLIVNTTQIPDTFARDFHACEDTNGVSQFDFSSVHSEIENLFPIGQELIINYYRNKADALAEVNPITDISNYKNIGYPNTQQIYVRVDSKINNDCLGLGAYINLYVDALPEFTIDTPQVVCPSDPTFTVTLDPLEDNPSEQFNYEWVYQDGTFLSNASTLTTSTPGTYSITLSKTDGTGCFRTKEVIVNALELATITLDDITIVDVSNNNTVTINTNNLGQGDYEFALDDEFSSYQEEPIFENISSGIHTLYVRDKKGCGTSSIDISIIGYPKFFTPNGDGNNDTWQIKGVNGQFQTESDIFIYDRYGKLLKQLSTTSNGWDGSFNGTLLSSDDYWFSVYLQDGREFKGHFTLKR